MVTVHTTRRRIVFGITLIIIGLIILDRSFGALPNIPLSFLIGFMSVVAIIFGGALVGSMPIKKILISLSVAGLWLFLFLLPLFLLPLPPEIPPLVGGFSSLLFVLLIGGYEKWKAKHSRSLKERDI